MDAAARKKRDEYALRLYLAGATYKQIAVAVELRSISHVHRIVRKQLADEASRRELLTDEAFAMYQERTEQLFQAHWGPALKGDYRSAEICRKILGQQARIYGLDDGGTSLPAPTGPLPTAPPPGEDGGGDQAPRDELAKLRAARAGA